MFQKEFFECIGVKSLVFETINIGPEEPFHLYSNQKAIKGGVVMIK